MPIDLVNGSLQGNAVLRERSVNAVLDALRDTPRLSRAELAQRTGLSKPTVGSALRVLERGGLVRERGRTTGRRGPSAMLFEPVADAALVLGVDIGTHHLRATAADLDGETVDEIEVLLGGADARHVLAAVREVRLRLAPHRTFELAVVGSPGVVDPSTGRIRSCPNIQGWEDVPAEAVLNNVLGVTTVVENDVNLAALGELARGAGRGWSSFLYLSVGSGLGAGLVLDGQLHRGRNGAAGEVGYLAVGAAPLADLAESGGSRGPMEHRLSHQAIVDGARAIDPGAPDNPRELFARARGGDALGRAVVAQTIDALAICIASVTAVLDLELVLLGGGIGAQADLLLEPVRSAASALVPYVPSIEAGTLGDHAVLAGAVSVGAELARASALKRCLLAAATS